MARVTIEDCLKNVDSRFSLMHLAVRRVLQLRSGGNPLVVAPKNKEIVVALREIAAGKVTKENIHLIEEAKALPDAFSREKSIVAAQELKEIYEEETQHGAPVDLPIVEDSGDQDDD